MSSAQTESKEYADYYLQKYNVWWRFALPWEVPFKFMARRICRGKTLDIGCGPGRYLSFLSEAVGIDHNRFMVEYARKRGFCAFSTHEFSAAAAHERQFDTLLFSHVIEHLPYAEACSMVSGYRRYLKAGGNVVIIVPQGRAYDNDPSHCCYFDDQLIHQLAEQTNLKVLRTIHHPFPQWLSKWLVNDAIYLCRAI